MYKAQALAIIMVILVVSSIIGLSVIARTMRDKGVALQERDSAEAYEVVDTILDNMLLTKLEDWLNVMNTSDTYTNTDISVLFNNLNHPLDLSDLSICPLTEEGNKYELRLSKGDDDTKYIVHPAQLFVFPIDGKNFGSDCRLSIKLEGTSTAGYMINDIFKEGSGVAPYNTDKTKSYCITDRSGICNTNYFLSSTGSVWETKKSGDLTTYTLNDTNLLKIQIVGINSPVTLSYSMSNGCTSKILLWKLRAAATCNGVYRAKEVVIPETRWTDAIFNYVLFNGAGNLSSSQ